MDFNIIEYLSGSSSVTMRAKHTQRMHTHDSHFGLVISHGESCSII